MVANNLVLIPGAGGVGRAVFDHLRAQDVPVRFMVRREDERAAEVKGFGAEVVIGDLTRPETVAAALQGVSRMFFAMAVSPDHLLAATVVASVAKEYGKLEALVDLSQMTVSQMTATSTEESHQQRLHWLAEQVLNWFGLPVVYVRPTCSSTLRCSPRWQRGPYRKTARSRCRSAPDAPRRSPWTTSPGSSPPCSATPLHTSDRSMS